jgi:hypothetical protein
MRIPKKYLEHYYGKMISEKDFSILGFDEKIHLEVYNGLAYCENFQGDEYCFSFSQVEFVDKSDVVQEKIREFLNLSEDEPITVYEILQTFNEMTKNGVRMVFDEETKEYKPKSFI